MLSLRIMFNILRRLAVGLSVSNTIFYPLPTLVVVVGQENQILQRWKIMTLEQKQDLEY